jgi:hypothetical protein
MLVAAFILIILRRLVTAHLLIQQVLTPIQAAQEYGALRATSQEQAFRVMDTADISVPTNVLNTQTPILALGIPSVPTEAVGLEPLTTTELTCAIAGTLVLPALVGLLEAAPGLALLG